MMWSKMRRRGVVVGLMLLSMMVVRGVSCSFEEDTAFVSPMEPENLPQFFAGKLDVIQQSYWKKHLAVAYRSLNGKPLSAAEQAEAARPDFVGVESDCCGGPTTPGAQYWQKARGEMVGDAAFEVALGDVSSLVPGENWEEFSNCLDDAYLTADKTFDARFASHPTQKLELADWMRGQLAVFSNCNGKGGQMPAAAPAGSPQWLMQDRAYQTAAAKFYQGDFPAARADFAKIAADSASPWHDLAAYLIGRCWIREATLAPDPKPSLDGLSQEQRIATMQAATNKAARDSAEKMRQAAAVFEPIAKGNGPYATDSQALLNLAMARTDRAGYAARTANRIAQGNDATIWQDLQDIQYFWKTENNSDTLAAADSQSELMDWVDTMRGESRAKGNATENAAAHALERWQATKSTAWLVAALTLAQKNDAVLAVSAKATAQSSPAWMAVTYHRLRLAPDHPTAHAELLALVPKLRANKETDSTLNLFLHAESVQATSLAEFLAAAPRRVVATGGPADGYQPAAPAPSFDSDATDVLNYKLPVQQMVEGVETSKLPAALRYQLSEAAWTRAVLLSKQELARRMTPMLADHPALRPWLTAYDNAKTDDERRIAGLIALMNVGGVSPDVANPHESFSDGNYNSFRARWECGNGPIQPLPVANGMYPATGDTDPPFVSAAMRTQATVEAKLLNRVSPGPDYFARESLAWIKAHPSDPRDEELAGFGFRALHDTCRYIESETPAEKDLSRQLFQLLHQRYPNSAWTKKYRVWP